ncbi:MAG TPA: hypothetical protein VL966_01550 [Alphaproteobacteria bacterium]|nr:hypothetical protein [Alphaproteobacteria bacterium]
MSIKSIWLRVRQMSALGLPWAADRVRRELEMPTTAPGQFVYRAIRPGRTIADSLVEATDRPRETLTAFYDLAVAPITFDFLWFLVGADLERRRGGYGSLAIVIVPGPENGLRREQPDYEAIIDPAARRARIANIFLPACALLPSISNVTIADSREQAESIARAASGAVFPDRYEPALPRHQGPGPTLDASRKYGVDVAVLRATDDDVDRARRWLAERSGGREVVAITLRDYPYMPARNSNLAAWTAFAAGLDPLRFFPVFIPDTDQCRRPFPDSLAPFALCVEAAQSIGFRAALYEQAFVNLGVNNGPMGLCWLNERTRYITFKMLSESVPQTTSEYMAFLGFDLGKSLPFATPYQKWVWNTDSLDVIQREFDTYVRRVDA